jgi:hypothetical protein
MMGKIYRSGGLACLVAFTAHADQVVMKNGDVYNGKLLSMTTNALVLQSEVLGKLTLSPEKVATINLGSGANTAPPPAAATTSLPRVPATAQTHANIELSGDLRQLGSQTNLIQQVQSQFLASAGPEANDKFNQLLSGLMSGQVSIDDLRKQAQTAADQLRAMRKDLGPEASETVDGYLSVLDSSLSEAGTTAGNTNTSPGAALTVKPPPAPPLGTQ